MVNRTDPAPKEDPRWMVAPRLQLEQLLDLLDNPAAEDSTDFVFWLEQIQRSAARLRQEVGLVDSFVRKLRERGTDGTKRDRGS